MTIAACMKWVDHRPEVDPLSGAVRTDWRSSGASDADRAALEWALRLGAAWHQPVVAVTAGTSAADVLLREALAVGARSAVRVDVPTDAPSAAVAAAIAGALGDVLDETPTLVLCGVWSLDRGSGSVPAFLAAELGAAQALGLVSLASAHGAILAERRLDRGARERVRVPLPAVCSVEGASARLRRAGLPAVIAASEDARITVARPERAAADDSQPVRTRPYRPRAKELPPPASPSARERVLALTGILTDRDPPQTLVLDPSAAADEVLAKLAAWGYRP